MERSAVDVDDVAPEEVRKLRRVVVVVIFCCCCCEMGGERLCDERNKNGTYILLSARQKLKLRFMDETE